MRRARRADFGEAMAAIAGVDCKVHFMAFGLPHSGVTPFLGPGFTRDQFRENAKES
jgi:hypothetical protein